MTFLLEIGSSANWLVPSQPLAIGTNDTPGAWNFIADSGPFITDLIKGLKLEKPSDLPVSWHWRFVHRKQKFARWQQAFFSFILAQRSFLYGFICVSTKSKAFGGASRWFYWCLDKNNYVEFVSTSIKPPLGPPKMLALCFNPDKTIQKWPFRQNKSEKSLLSGSKFFLSMPKAPLPANRSIKYYLVPIQLPW